LFSRLQLKPRQRIRPVNQPAGLAFDLETTTDADAEAILVFATNRAELDAARATIVEHGREDRLTWLAYPKAGKLGTDLNRDIIWKLMDGSGVRPIRQIALDDTWSALRFRPA
jgi:hypothetical protein